MATPQHCWAYRFIGESYDSGSGNTRTVTWPQGTLQAPVTTNQTVAPFIQTLSFTLPYTLLGNIFTDQIGSNGSGQQFLKNRSEYEWMTAYCTMNLGGSYTSQLVGIPLPPLRLIFLPANIILINNIVAGNVYDGNAPVPGSTNQMFLDYGYWY